MRVARPDFKAHWMTKIIRAQWVPEELAVLVPEVEQLIERLPTISMRELSGALLEVLESLRAFRDLEFHPSEAARKAHDARRADESCCRAPLRRCAA